MLPMFLCVCSAPGLPAGFRPAVAFMADFAGRHGFMDIRRILINHAELLAYIGMFYLCSITPQTLRLAKICR